MLHSKINRRDFFRQSLLLSGGLAASQLTACSTIDRWFGIEKKKFDDEVLIIGAGAAGLSAAFELKKKGIPYRVYESSSRVGGRIYTLENFNEDHQFVELGGEYFESQHTPIMEICRELKLATEKIENDSHFEKELYFVHDRIMTRKDLTQLIRPLSVHLAQAQADLFGGRSDRFYNRRAKDFPKAAQYDAMSLRDFLNSTKEKIDPEFLQTFERICVSQFGVEAPQLSSLHLLHSLDLESHENNYEGKTFYRVQGGNGVLIRTMYERIAGIVPDYLVRLNRELVSISEDGGYFNCLFQGPTGYEEIETRRLICTIPINHLKKIYGIEKLEISELKKEAIQKVELATHSKGMISFKERFWKNRADSSYPSQGTLLGGMSSQSIWDSSRQQSGKRGILSLQCGGEKGAQASFDYLEKSFADLQLLNRHVQNSVEGVQQVMNWSQRKWSGGSVVYYRPGDYFKFNGIMGEPEYQGRLMFAGEHTHIKNHGTMSGAIESGLLAARQIVEAVK